MAKKDDYFLDMAKDLGKAAIGLAAIGFSLNFFKK